MYLIFDSSANGKPKSYKLPHDDTFNWPRLLQLSWIILNEELKPDEDYNCVIKPEGFKPAPKAMKSHHIDQEHFDKTEDTLTDVLTKFKESVDKCDYVFAHNLAYNEGVVGAEYYRQSKVSPLIGADSYCLMHESTYFCKLKGKRGYKWPSLQELHTSCFKQGFTPSGHARADVIAATRAFIYLKRARAFEDIFVED